MTHKLGPVYLLLNLAKTHFKQNYNMQQLPLEMEGEQALFLILSIQVRNNSEKFNDNYFNASITKRG